MSSSTTDLPSADLPSTDRVSIDDATLSRSYPKNPNKVHRASVQLLPSIWPGVLSITLPSPMDDDLAEIQARKQRNCGHTFDGSSHPRSSMSE